MKVLDLACANDHRFEGWFASDDDEAAQRARGLLACPLCGDAEIRRLPSAPRLNLGASPPAEKQAVALPAADDLQAQWMRAVRHMLEHTEDVGERFADEARRIHYGEVARRGIRGQATRADAEALRDEGIDVMSLPLPPALDGPLQ
ncbi:MAG: DUF1178 family protein [Ideonella sp.]|nr:DUF1178 family protein [Ideonella sp.]